MRSLSYSIVTLFCWCALPALAQDAAVLPLDLGAGPDDAIVEVQELLGATDHVTVLSPDVIRERIDARYRPPAGVDAVWVESRVQQSEDAYYTMQFDAAIAALSGPVWESALDAVVDMALNPDLAANIHNGLMTRARSYFYADQMAEADGAILQSLHRFPEEVATTERYQPEFVAHFNEIREEFRLGTTELVVEAPGDECARQLNGRSIGQGRDVHARVGSGSFAVRVNCGRTPSRTHLIEVEGATSVYVDPSFDWAFRQATGVLALDDQGDALFESLPAMARAWGDVVGVRRVIAVGVTQDDQLLLVDIAVPEQAVTQAVRAERDGEDRFPTREAVDALLTGQPSTGVAVAGEGDWDVPSAGGGGGGIGAATWVSFAVSGAAFVTGVAFAVIESNRWDDFDRCKADPGCSGSSELSDFRNDAERAGLIATIGIGVGIAAALTGAILLAVDLRAERQTGDEQPDDAVEASAWIPSVRSDLSHTGGGFQLDWRF